MTHQHEETEGAYVWADIFTQAVSAFEGQRPTSALEAQLLTHFQARPAELQAAIQKTTQRFKAGKIHSPWPIVKHELEQAAARETITSSDTRERSTATRQAEAWIRNAGHYLDTKDELIDELFGQHGKLRQWADDQPLHDHLTQLWEHEHQRAELANAARIKRATAWRNAHPHPPTTPATADNTTAEPAATTTDIPL